MAYKSRVTNKYMGSTFAGRVNPGRENELTQLARTLDDFSDAVPKAVAAYKGKKIDEAEERLEELRTTMSPEELNDYILKGEDKILFNKWSVSVVDGQLGRFDAADAINKIVEQMTNMNTPQVTGESSINNSYQILVVNLHHLKMVLVSTSTNGKQETYTMTQQRKQNLDKTVRLEKVLSLHLQCSMKI